MRIRQLIASTHRVGAVLGLAAAVASVSVIATPATASADMWRHHEAESHSVDITAVDFHFVISTHGGVEAGLVNVRFHNRDHDDHNAQLFRLNDGVAPAKFKTDLISGGPGAFLADVVPDGGAAVTRGRDHQPVWDALQGGTYAVVCFVSGPDGVPHFVKGMIGFFDVHGRVNPERLARLHPNREVEEEVIKAHDLTYTMPKKLSKNAIYRFENTDAMDIHEINLGRLKPGKTVADAKAYFIRLAHFGNPGPPPFTSEGGHGGVLPNGGHGFFRVDDDPGHYVAFCLVPDDKTGVSHAAEGMVVGVVVR
jgi:hypothetical protein